MEEAKACIVFQDNSVNVSHPQFFLRASFLLYFDYVLPLFGLDLFTKALEDIVVIRTRVLTDWYARYKKS